MEQNPTKGRNEGSFVFLEVHSRHSAHLRPVNLLFSTPAASKQFILHFKEIIWMIASAGVLHDFTFIQSDQHTVRIVLHQLWKSDSTIRFTTIVKLYQVLKEIVTLPTKITLNRFLYTNVDVDVTQHLFLCILCYSVSIYTAIKISQVQKNNEILQS